MTHDPFSVLVVDDNSDACKMLVTMLRHLKCLAVCRESGEAAIEYLNTKIPGLIFLDVMMPHMDGFQVLGLIRANPQTADVPIIMYSAMDDSETHLLALALGADAFIVKGTMRLAALGRVIEHYRDPPHIPDDELLPLAG